MMAAPTPRWAEQVETGLRLPKLLHLRLTNRIEGMKRKGDRVLLRADDGEAMHVEPSLNSLVILALEWYLDDVGG